jgi:hypothetical protein
VHKDCNVRKSNAGFQKSLVLTTPSRRSGSGAVHSKFVVPVIPSSDLAQLPSHLSCFLLAGAFFNGLAPSWQGFRWGLHVSLFSQMPCFALRFPGSVYCFGSLGGWGAVEPSAGAQALLGAQAVPRQ